MNAKYRFRIDSSKPNHTIGLQTFCNSASRIPEIIRQHGIELPDCVSTVTEIDQTPATPAPNPVNAHDSLVSALRRCMAGLTCRSIPIAGVRVDCQCWPCETARQVMAALAQVEEQQ